jgi:hypothetical protein
MALFRRKKQAPVAPALASTGHSGDDQLLQLIAADGDINAPRHWIHYLYFPNEQTAREAAEVVESAGWALQQVAESAAGGPEWVVIAERHGAVTIPSEVQAARLFFEGVAHTNGPGEYDGWEASA